MSNENETLPERKARLKALREARDAALPPAPTPAELTAARKARAAQKNARRGRNLRDQLIASCYALDKPTGDAVARLFEDFKHKL